MGGDYMSAMPALPPIFLVSLLVIKQHVVDHSDKAAETRCRSNRIAAHHAKDRQGGIAPMTIEAIHFMVALMVSPSS